MPASASSFSRSTRQFFCCRLYSFLQLFGLGGFVLGVELLDLTLEGAHDVDGLVDLVEQALLLRVGVLELADDAGEVDGLAADEPARLAQVRALAWVSRPCGDWRLSSAAAFFWCLTMTSMRPTVALDAGGEDLFGQFLFVEGDDFLDVADAAAEVFAEADDLADDDGRARDGLHDAELAALDAFGDFDFALAGEQGDGAHLAQVHADGVVGLLKLTGGEVELDVFGLFAGLGLELVASPGTWCQGRGRRCPGC